MMAPSRKPQVSLRSGRPPTIQKAPTSISSKNTQKLIIAYHALQKDLAKATAANDHEKVTFLQAQIDALGGLEAYQRASIQGQSTSRGGDSSLVLMAWLKSVTPALKALPKPFKMLEVGALSTKNACSTSKLFAIERIDLNAQSPGITQQDFMQRPLPTNDEERFDMISLSLVLNFVPDTKGRGEMLRRTTKFLRRDPSSPMQDLVATLFLVLPAPCIENARYCTEERLTLIMTSLGYCLLQRKQTAKLVYYLWQWRDEVRIGERFTKQMLRDKGGMNNFCIEVLNMSWTQAVFQFLLANAHRQVVDWEGCQSPSLSPDKAVGAIGCNGQAMGLSEMNMDRERNCDDAWKIHIREIASSIMTYLTLPKTFI